MCPSQAPWPHTIANLVDSIVGTYGANGIYVDEVSCNSHELCFNKDHLHPLGGGRYWADGWLEFYQKIMNVAHQNGRDVVVTSKAANEMFFDLVRPICTPEDRPIRKFPFKKSSIRAIPYFTAPSAIFEKATGFSTSP